MWPANTNAQTQLAQDLSVTGVVSARPSANERSVGFTVTNHGPGSFTGFARLSIGVDPTVAYLRLLRPCNMTPPDTATVTC